MTIETILLVTIICSHVVAIAAIVALYWLSRPWRHVESPVVWDPPKSDVAQAEPPAPPDFSGMARTGAYALLPKKQQDVVAQLLADQYEEDQEGIEVQDDQLSTAAGNALHRAGVYTGEREDI